MKKRGFTLIELIVVIAILAILGTIAFISFKGFTGDAKNSKILTDMDNLQMALTLHKVKSEVVPIPENYKTVTAGGTDITYEGEVGDVVRNAIKVDGNMKDPDGKNYRYSTNGALNTFNVLGLLGEYNANLSTTAYAGAEVYNKYFLGDEVLNLFDANGEYFAGDITDGSLPDGITAYLKDNEMLILDNVVQNVPAEILTNDRITDANYTSCRGILKAGKSSGDGVYRINAGKGNRYVYCDMTSDGGGWTLILKQDGTKNTLEYNSPLWLNEDVLNEYSNDLTKTELKSKAFNEVAFSEVRMTFDTNGDVRSGKFALEGTSMLDLMKEPFTPVEFGKENWMNLFPGSKSQPNCNREGVNNLRVRLGFSANNENDCKTNDTRIGFGTRPRGGKVFAHGGLICGSTLCSGYGLNENLPEPDGYTAIPSFGYLFVR